MKEKASEVSPSNPLLLLYGIPDETFFYNAFEYDVIIGFTTALCHGRTEYTVVQ